MESSSPGLGKLTGRIGHLGSLHETDVLAIMATLEAALVDLDLCSPSGSAIMEAYLAMQAAE